jgi:signal transduction histidine kinase
MPRRTLRTQLTLLYAGPFLVSGIALLAIPLLGTKQTVHAGPNGIGPSTPQDGNVHQVLIASAIGLAVMVVISFVLGWLIAGRFLRPLRTITATARDISASNLHRRLGLRGRDDEFTELADTLDDLFGRLETSFESQRRFVANASHELRTPLTAERTLLQVALADPDASAETLRSTCHDVLNLGAAQERLIEALLTLAVSEQGIEKREPVDLADIARRVVDARRTAAEHRRIHLDTSLAPAPFSGDPNLVESLVANMVDNAIRHNVDAGRIEIATTTNEGHARITVVNTGPVIPPDDVNRLFQPFQRLGRQRVGRSNGYGLGLAIVRAVARAHGATLSPRARPDGGLDIQVTFP